MFAVAGFRVEAQMASSVTSLPTSNATVLPESVPTAVAAEVPAVTPQESGKKSVESKTGEAPVMSKGEYIEWRRGYVSGVSDRVITVVVSTAQRRGSYEPVEITSKTKITRSGRPAVLKDIRIRQYAGVRGYREGDIVKATEYAIGGLPYAKPARRTRASRKAKPAPKRVVPSQKAKAPLKAKIPVPKKSKRQK